MGRDGLSSAEEFFLGLIFGGIWALGTVIVLLRLGALLVLWRMLPPTLWRTYELIVYAIGAVIDLAIAMYITSKG
ncbi:MAG: hypothetical protein DRJ67_10380 [Thermoprotei archaeon]|nr:MAG: hypothetical protein DRJ67_10380 [Thermoprotei archaeon]